MKKDRTEEKQVSTTFCAAKRVPGKMVQARFDLLRKICQGTVF